MRPPPQRVVVTGAASGIGAALARRLGGGDAVIGIDRRADGVPPSATPLVCDLRNPASVDAAAAALADGGPITGFAAVAGVPGTAAPRTVLAVNVVGLRRLLEAVLPAMADGGAIVLLASLAGYRGPASPEQARALVRAPDEDVLAAAADLDGPSAYQLSKQLVQHYAVELAARLHPRGIRCVSLSPGPVRTPILADFRATMPSLDAAEALVGRLARPEEIAAVAAFALSPDASWLNGVDVRLDGGLSALRALVPE